MKKKKWKLMASATSEEELIRMFALKWQWVGIHFNLLTNEVFLKGKKMDALRIIKKQNRLRIEREVVQ